MRKKDQIFESKDKWLVIVDDNRDGTKEYYDILPEDKHYKIDLINDQIAKRNEREKWDRWTVNPPVKVPGKEYKGGTYFFGGFGYAMDVVCYDCAIEFLQNVLKDAEEVNGEFILDDGTWIRRRNPLEVSGEYKTPLKDEVIRQYYETDEYNANLLLTRGLICGGCERMMASPLRCAIIIGKHMAGTDKPKK